MPLTHEEMVAKVSTWLMDIRAIMLEENEARACKMAESLAERLITEMESDRA